MWSSDLIWEKPPRAVLRMNWAAVFLFWDAHWRGEPSLGSELLYSTCPSGPAKAAPSGGYQQQELLIVLSEVGMALCHVQPSMNREKYLWSLWVVELEQFWHLYLAFPEFGLDISCVMVTDVFGCGLLWETTVACFVWSYSLSYQLSLCLKAICMWLSCLGRFWVGAVDLSLSFLCNKSDKISLQSVQ